MPDQLTFMMGEFAAEFLTDRMYADNHMWAQRTGDADAEVIRYGFTAYAVRLLQDVYFLDWLVEAPCALTRKQELGSIESKKAESALYAPIPGQLLRFNDQLMADPSSINVDKYESGWLFEIQSSSADQQSLLTTEEYVQMLDKVWEKTQRTIKGQMNG